MADQECADIATKVIKLYAVSDALTHGWEYLEPERRAESIGRLKKRVGDLSENKHISEKSASRVMGSLELMESINKGPITQQHVTGILLPAVVDMAVQAIGDCVCGEDSSKLETEYIYCPQCGHNVEPVREGEMWVCPKHGTDSIIPKKPKPTRYDVKVTVWEERDRLHIGIVDKATEQISYADWWDDDARQMFEDGFFSHKHGLENSVLEYAEDMGILAK